MDAKRGFASSAGLLQDMDCMGHFHGFWKVSAAVLLSAGMRVVERSRFARADDSRRHKPDAQIEASVLKALAGARRSWRRSVDHIDYGVRRCNAEWNGAG